MPPLTTSTPSLDLGHKKRGIAGRITMNPLEKRRETTITTFGGCPLATPSDSPVTLPDHPRASRDLLVPEQAGTLDPRFSAISRYDRATTDGCVFTTTRLSASAYANVPQWRDSWGTVQPRNNELSLDHACKFFYNLLSNNKTDIHQTKRVGS